MSETWIREEEKHFGHESSYKEVEQMVSHVHLLDEYRDHIVLMMLKGITFIYYL